jgi:hypothetical protein
MPKTVNINHLLSQVEKLDNTTKLNLIERIISLIKKEQKPKNKTDITALNGLGKEIWKDVDIDKYLENERKW